MSQIGFKKDDIDTPALLIDLDIMEKNISTMANFFKDKKARLRAHTKVHRTPIIAKKQIEAGAKGLCCQKVTEAEVMATAGIKDIMVTNQIISPLKIEKLISLNNYANISVPVDNVSNAINLSKAALRKGTELKVLIDIHMGSNRCGVEPGKPALKLAEQIHKLKGLKLIGLMGFEGHISTLEPRETRRVEIQRLENLLVKTKHLIERSGIEVTEISTGSTGTYDVSGADSEVTEVQAGTYVLMDAEYQSHVQEFDCALSVLSTIISKPSEDRVVTDAGLMSIYSTGGKPIISGTSNINVLQIHAENTLLKIEKSANIEIGQKIELIPPYLDGTVKLHNKFHAMRRGRVEAIWDILGRDTST